MKIYEYKTNNANINEIKNPYIQISKRDIILASLETPIVNVNSLVSSMTQKKKTN